MKPVKVLAILFAVIIVTVSGINVLVYSKEAYGAEKVENQMRGISPIGKGSEKSSPLHAWKAIVKIGKKMDDTITNKELSNMRIWSTKTKGYELQSLTGIGVLSRKDKKGDLLPEGVYRLVVDATPGQIDLINEEAKVIINKTDMDGIAIGIDSYRLDIKYIGADKLKQIASVVRRATGVSAVNAAEAVADLVQSDMDRGKNLPSSVAINGDIPFTVNNTNLRGIGVANTFEQRLLLAGLVEIKIVSPEGKVKGKAANFSATNAKVIMFKDEFVIARTYEFKTDFGKLGPDGIAVIVAIDKNNGEIKAALEQAELAEKWGDSIVVIGIKTGSVSVQAFKKLFGNNNTIDLRNQTINKILENKDLVEGLKGSM